MKKDKLLILVIALALVIGVVIAIAVASGNNYTDTYSSPEIYENVKDSFVTEGGTKVLDDDVILEFTDKDIDYLVDYIVIKANNAKNINEIGIFKLKDGKAAEFKKIVTQYLEGIQQKYRAMDYFPEEVEKIDCAKVEVYGNYVIYSFLNENDTEAFYRAVENLITK